MGSQPMPNCQVINTDKYKTKCECDIYWYCISIPGMSLAGAWTEWKPDWPPMQTTEAHILELLEESTDFVPYLADAKRELDKQGKTMMGRRGSEITDFNHLYIWTNCAKLSEEHSRIANDNMTKDEKQAMYEAEKEEKYRNDLATLTDWYIKVRGIEPTLRSDNKYFLAK